MTPQGLTARVSAARVDTERRGETFYPGPSRIHLAAFEFIYSPAKRKVIRAGRRSGKTVGVSVYAVMRFLAGKRSLYAAPTTEQLDSFWSIVTEALYEPIKLGALYKNETEHSIEVSHTKNRIRAKTAWSADTLRGDFADELILDEWQLMDEDAWDKVGAPMLLDNNGNAIFVYTPPSLRSRSVSKSRDPQHAAKMYRKAQEDTSGRWAAFHFTSHDNPYISQEALSDITRDMSAIGYRQEILAEDIDQAPGALWTRESIEKGRVYQAPELERIVVAVDPSATSTGDEAGIVTAGKKDDQFYCIADDTLQGSPLTWARAAVTAYHVHKADCIVAESNQGGEMVQLTIAQVDPAVPARPAIPTRTAGSFPSPTGGGLVGRTIRATSTGGSGIRITRTFSRATIPSSETTSSST